MSQTTELLLRIRQQGGQELVKLQGSLKNLGQQTSATNVNFKELAQELKKVQATSTQSINNLKGYANAWKEIANSVDVTSDEFRIARAESTALEARLKTFQGSQTAVANNFRNIASAANQAAAAMRTTTGLMRDPLTGAYRGTAGVTQYGAPIGPALPPDVAGRIAQQQREAASQSARDARRRIKMQERAQYMGAQIGARDPVTGALIARSSGQPSPYFQMGQQYARPIGPQPAAGRRGLPLGRIARTGGAIAAAGIFGGPEGALGAGIGSIFGGPAGAAIGGAVGAQISMLRKAIGDTGTYLAEIKKLNIALAGVSKSQKDFNDNIGNISKLSKQFLIPIKDTTQQYTKLQASVAGAGMTSQETEKVFKGIAAAVTATGGSTEDLNSALRATSQVFSKGKVSAEELRQQIGERLPGAFTIFADSIGKTPQELDKALENGEVTLEDFIKFSEELFKRYGKTANLIAEAPENAGKRLQMALDNIAVQIGRFAGPIGAGFQAIATSIVEGLTPAFEAFANLLDLPKVAAKERLAQIKRQIPQKELDIQTYRGMAQLLGASGGMFNIQADVAEMSLKQLRGEQATLEGVVKGIGKGLGDNVYKPGGALDKGGKKKKEIKDITESELFLYNKIEDALDSGNQLQAEFLQSSLKLLQVQQQLDTGEIKSNNATKERRQAQGQIYRAIEAQRESMNAVSQQYVDQKESVKEQMQALEIQYGLTTQKQAEEIAFEQQMDDLRKAAKSTTLAKDVEELIAKLRNARQAAESFGNQISKSFAETVKQSGELAQNLGATLGNAFLGLGDQLADFVTTGKMQFADFARSVLNDLTRIFIKAAMFEALRAIVPSGSSFARFLGFANGGIMTSNGSMPLRRYANGGIATSPQIAMFGEGSRPEAYVPLPDGRSIPVTMRGGGEMGNIVVNVDAAGSAVQGNQPDANKLGEALGIAVRQELIRQKRPGGLLA
jgi:lambda family phage tail tape measure protein